MKKLALALLFCGVSAFAGSVTYSTSGAFSGTDASGSGLANGSATITYNPQSSITVSTPTGINIGSLVVAGGSGTFSGDTFALTIWQTSPSTGNSTTSTTISGSVSGNSNNILVSFSPASFSIGSITYTLQNSTYFLVAPNTNSGVTSLQANVVAPEPASLGLIGASLMGLGMAFRRRFAK